MKLYGKQLLLEKTLVWPKKIDSKVFFKKLTMDSDSPTPTTFDQTLCKTTIARKNLGLTEKNRVKIIFQKSNDGFGFPDPDYLWSNFMGNN